MKIAVIPPTSSELLIVDNTDDKSESTENSDFAPFPEKMRAQILSSFVGNSPLKTLFAEIDVDGDGKIRRGELQDAFLGRGLSRAHFRRVWKDLMKCDFNDDGMLEWDEFQFFFKQFEQSTGEYFKEAFCDKGVWATGLWAIGVFCIMCSDIHGFLSLSNQDFWDVFHFIGNIAKLVASGLFVILSMEYLRSRFSTSDVVRTIMRNQRQLETKLSEKIARNSEMFRRSLHMVRTGHGAQTSLIKKETLDSIIEEQEEEEEQEARRNTHKNSQSKESNASVSFHDLKN